MNTYDVELREDFIKDLFQASNTEWRARIKYSIPEAFESENGWYKDVDNEKTIIKFNSFKEYNKNYGINAGGEWTNTFGFVGLNSKIPATNAEVKEVLVRQAEERGLVKGVETISLIGSRGLISTNEYLFENGNLYADNGRLAIFCNGKWAEPLEKSILTRVQKLEEELKKLKR